MNKTPTGPPRILVRGVNWLGDAVMTTPALLRLREKFRDSHIAILTPFKLAELYFEHPAISEIIPIMPQDNLFAVAGKLRAKRFDLALILPNSPRSALEAWLARIPRRIGHARGWRNALLTQAVAPRADAVTMRKRSITEIEGLTAGKPALQGQTVERFLPKIPPPAHQVHEYLHLVAAAGASSEPLRPWLNANFEDVLILKKRFGLDQITSPIIGLNPGAEYGPAKRWPSERFIESAIEISKRTGCYWLLFGGKGDTAITVKIAAALSVSAVQHQNLAGRTTLGELMGLLKLCRAMLTNDTGPMHLAAAVGTPVVVPFGSTSPELTGPGLPGDSYHYLLKSDAPCAPCFLRECPIDFRCMNGIDVEPVTAAVIAAMNRTPQTGNGPG